MLLLEELTEHGYEETESLSMAFYILADGTMWEGCFDSGIRGYDHREVEVFTTFDRYDGNDFWEEVFLKLNLVMVIPETKKIMVHPQQKLFSAQAEVVDYAISAGYEVITYE